MKKIFAICGSTRSNSSNLQIIKAVEKLLPLEFKLEIFENISSLPHFNPDLDQDSAPEPVLKFRTFISEADGILLCTPEYAMGLPGSFKNAIDWTVSSASFSKKPMLSIVASSQGEMAYQSLNSILNILEVKPTTQLIPFVRSKINEENEIIDEQTLEELAINVSKFMVDVETPTSI